MDIEKLGPVIMKYSPVNVRSGPYIWRYFLVFVNSRARLGMGLLSALATVSES